MSITLFMPIFSASFTAGKVAGTLQRAAAT